MSPANFEDLFTFLTVELNLSQAKAVKLALSRTSRDLRKSINNDSSEAVREWIEDKIVLMDSAHAKISTAIYTAETGKEP